MNRNKINGGSDGSGSPPQALQQTPPHLPLPRGTIASNLRLAGYTLTGILIALLFLSFSLPYLQENSRQAKDFLLSPHFLFLYLSAILLCWKGVPSSRYNLLVAALISTYLALFYGSFLSLLHMSGDSICQVAYWNILWRPNLQGSIGVAFTKPGQVLYLGTLSQLAIWAGNWGGAYLFKAGLILAMTACVWSLVRIAADLGGRVAGLLAFLLTICAFLNDFLMSESTIYFIAVLFSGLRLYFYQPRYRTLGCCLLVISLQFRIEAIAILAIIGLGHTWRREWLELRRLTLYTLASLVIFVLIIFQVQGSLARLNSGAAVGYVSPIAESTATKADQLDYIIQNAANEFKASPSVRFFSILALLGIVGAFAFQCQPYLVVFASLLVIVANALLLGGTFNLGRYVSFVYGFACSVGAASLILFLRAIPRTRYRHLPLAIGGSGILALLLIFDYSTLNVYKYLDPALESGFLRSTRQLLDEPTIPAGSNLLSEDDLLSHLVVLDPERYQKLTSLQLFNVSNDSARMKILAESNYIWIELESYYYYYLFYLDNPLWNSDPFRGMVKTLLVTGREQTLYGYRFIPIARNHAGLVVKIDKSHNVSPEK